jgi:uncharacterized protein YndB with AHSA1/START domain
MEKYNWSKFTQRIAIKAPVQEIYDCWTTQEGIEKWFLRLGEFSNSETLLKDKNAIIQKNDNYKWMWHGYPDEVVEFGKIIEANGHNMIQFTFAEQCLVTIKIYNELNENIIELTQENIPTDEYSKTQFHLGCSNGWTFYLANLKSILEGGIDLRNKNIELTKVINS